MKNNIRIILLLLLISTSIHKPFAQVASGSSTKKLYSAIQMMHIQASKYLNGINTDVNYAKAKQIYKALASMQDAKAMNALGVMYKNGLGVTQSNDSARYYFEKGAALDNPKSLLNLGLIYKNGDGVTQDFTKSFDYFKKSLEKGNKGAYYALGYYYYKGLGVEQNYTKGLEYFQAGADMGIPPCMYMNGYCHLKGYGVAQDTVLGKQWISKASQKGYDRAIDFITENKISDELRNPTNKTLLSAEAETFVPQKFTAKERNGKDKLGNAKIDGIWIGKLISYDWSGNKIVSERKLEVYLNSEGNMLIGIWTQEDSISIRIEGNKLDSNWVFTNSKYEKENRRSWQINQGSFELIELGNKNFLKGTVTLYNLITKEPSKPAYIVLEKIDKKRNASLSIDDKESIKVSSISVTPNPFSQEFIVKIMLNQAQVGSIEIFDLLGWVVHSTGESNFDEGDTDKQLSINLVAGTYSVRFNGKQTQLSTLIIKK